MPRRNFPWRQPEKRFKEKPVRKKKPLYKFRPPKELDCFGKYGYANGWFHDLEERKLKFGAETALTGCCQKCFDGDNCVKKTLATREVLPNDAGAMLSTFFALEVEGCILRNLRDLAQENTSPLPEVSQILNTKSADKQLGCFGKYGYGFGYTFAEEVQTCRVCEAFEPCMEETYRPILEQEKQMQKDENEAWEFKVWRLQLARLITNLKAGATDRKNGVEPKPYQEPETTEDGV